MAQAVRQRTDTEPTPLRNLYARLSYNLPEYAFDSSQAPFHSSYDNWHVIGKFKRSQSQHDNRSTSTASLSTGTSPSSVSNPSAAGLDDYVVARITQNGLRIEREYRQAQMLCANDVDDEMEHFVRPVRLARMPARDPSELDLVVSVVEAPSLTYLDNMGMFRAAVHMR